MAELVAVKTKAAVPATAHALAAAGHSTGALAKAVATVLADDRRHGAVPKGLTPDLTSRPRMEFEPPKADLTEPLEILTDEIAMCLRYHEGVFPGRRVDRAIFFGGEARHLGLCQHIARTLRLPAQVADPMAGVARSGQESTPGVDFRNTQPGWAMTMGLCLCQTDL
jgi:Tfp pilus assembly PilM family ATPase